MYIEKRTERSFEKNGCPTLLFREYLYEQFLSECDS